MISILSILFVSLVLIFIEFFIPGGIVGIIGVCGILFSIYKFSLQDADLMHLIIYVLFCLATVYFVIKVALNKIKNSPSSGVYSNEDQEGYLASEFENALLGQEGEVVSDLKPSGYIEVEKKRYQAVSKLGYIPKGKKVIIKSGQGGHLNVVLKED